MESIAGLDLDAFINFSIDPQNTREIIKVQQGLAQSPNRKEMSRWTYESAMHDASFKNLYETKYFEKLPSIEELADMPDGSLGRVLAKHLSDNNINLDFSGLDTEAFYKTIDNPVGYLGLRALKYHDVYHAVLDLGANPIDEYALASFQLGQFQSPYHMVLLASGLLNVTFFEPEKIPDALQKIHKFYGLGKTAKFFPGFQFESHWKTPISEIKKILGV